MIKKNGATTTTSAKVVSTGPSITDVNQLLEKLLLRELPLKKNGIDISFDQPNREWSSRLNGPTINLFLYDLRKNKYREAQPQVSHSGRNKMTIRRPFLKVDLNYVITAWVIDGNPDEEHYLLTATLLALARHPLLPSTRGRFLPEDAKIDVSFLPEPLRNQPSLIPIMVAEPESLVNPADVWSALDNELRPCITCTTTLALDPFVPIEVPMPSGRNISVTPRGEGTELRRKRPSYGVNGVIRSKEPLQNMRLILLGRGLNGRGLFVPLIPNESLTEYEFELPQLRYGDYSLEVSATDQAPIGFEIALPTKELEKEEQKGGISFNIKIEELID